MLLEAHRERPQLRGLLTALLSYAVIEDATAPEIGRTAELN
jgi:hypothetical protein